MIGTFDIASIFKLVMQVLPIIQQIFGGSESQAFSETSNPTSEQSNRQISLFNSNLQQFKSGDFNFERINNLENITDEKTAFAAVEALNFSAASLQFSTDPADIKLRESFLTEAAAIGSLTFSTTPF